MTTCRGKGTKGVMEDKDEAKGMVAEGNDGRRYGDRRNNGRRGMMAKDVTKDGGGRGMKAKQVKQDAKKQDA
jgi:hypothetical protein